jgi:hypothetical protein
MSNPPPLVKEVVLDTKGDEAPIGFSPEIQQKIDRHKETQRCELRNRFPAVLEHKLKLCVERKDSPYATAIGLLLEWLDLHHMVRVRYDVGCYRFYRWEQHGKDERFRILYPVEKATNVLDYILQHAHPLDLEILFPILYDSPTMMQTVRDCLYSIDGLGRFPIIPSGLCYASERGIFKGDWQHEKQIPFSNILSRPLRQVYI